MNPSTSPKNSEGSSHPTAFTMTPGRLEAFSDGVFAFAITLLALNFQVPHAPSGGLVQALLAQWPSYVTYVVSFFSIGIIWINHYAILRLIARVNRPMLVMNLIHLLSVAFLPYPTALLGAYIQSERDAEAAAVLYAGTMTVGAIGFTGFWIYAVLRGFLRDFVNPTRARAAIPQMSIALLAYPLGIVVAFFSAPLSLALFALIHVYYLFNQTAETLARRACVTPDGRAASAESGPINARQRRARRASSRMADQVKDRENSSLLKNEGPMAVG